jgi:hypothetical protein
MIKNYFRWQSTVSTPSLVALAFLSFVFNLWATDLLNAAYAASAFPVPYWQAQLSFDHEKIKLWYGFLLDKGTLERYVHTQNIDFIFIASVLLLHTSALLAIARLLPSQSLGRRLVVWASLVSMIAPLADAVENGFSYIMLADPTGFDPVLAIAYSSAAALKFAMFTFAYVAAIGGLLAWLYVVGARLRNRARAARQSTPKQYGHSESP